MRRYHSCPHHEHDCAVEPHKYHNALALLDELDAPLTHLDNVGLVEPSFHDDPPHDDPRWPLACVCGYAFTRSDELVASPLAGVLEHGDPWQLFTRRLWRAPDGAIYTIEDAPPGAMWNAWWLADHDRWCGPDGMSVFVKLPGGYEWGIDCPSTSGSPWTRTGIPPVLTVSPSILSPNYHGWLKDGVLHDA